MRGELRGEIKRRQKREVGTGNVGYRAEEKPRKESKVAREKGDKMAGVGGGEDAG